MKDSKKYEIDEEYEEDEDYSEDDNQNKGLEPEILNYFQHIMKVTDKYKDGIPLEKYDEWKYEISNPNYEKESEKQRRMSIIRQQMGNCGHDNCDHRRDLLTQSYDDIIELHLETDPDWEPTKNLLPVANINKQIREIAHYVLTYAIKFNQATNNLSGPKKFDEKLISKFKNSKKVFDSACIETIGIDMKGMEDYFKCLQVEIEDEMIKNFNTLKNYKSNKDLLLSIMKTYYAFKLLGKVFDSVFEDHHIIGIIKAFKLSITCDHNLIRVMINGFFWKLVFKNKSLIDLLATPDSDLIL